MAESGNLKLVLKDGGGVSWHQNLHLQTTDEDEAEQLDERGENLLELHVESVESIAGYSKCLANFRILESSLQTFMCSDEV